MRRLVLVVLAAGLTSTPAAPASGDDPTHVFPVPGSVAFGAGHVAYPATDVMARCGRPVLAPVAGRVLEIARRDRWRRDVDDPATRGGRFVSILGRDGVRYYLAHLAHVRRTVQPGAPVRAGQLVGTVGRSGRAGVCHVHLGLSPNCDRPDDWWVRRGVVPPFRYLRAWQRGEPADPGPDVRSWLRRHPDACTSATAEG